MVIFHKESDYLLISIIQEGRLFRRQREKTTTTNKQKKQQQRNVEDIYFSWLHEVECKELIVWQKQYLYLLIFVGYEQ